MGGGSVVAMSYIVGVGSKVHALGLATPSMPTDEFLESLAQHPNLDFATESNPFVATPEVTERSTNFVGEVCCFKIYDTQA